jgi:hypothetical protein
VTFKPGPGMVWIMPVNAVPLGTVGSDMTYATEEGLGTAEGIPVDGISGSFAGELVCDEEEPDDD